MGKRLKILGIIAIFTPYFALAQMSLPSSVGVTVVPGPTAILPTPASGTLWCPYRDLTMSIGTTGDKVKALQDFLAQDPAIYPEGLVTGYYGPLTQAALKRLQTKVGLPATGTLDDDTREIIFPCVSIRVISPNGGEVWERSQIQTIQWDVIE
ncbi:MAG: peptidoglycan-binding domain-containing protein, partial [Candidatus Paceibacteria bacterium]